MSDSVYVLGVGLSKFYKPSYGAAYSDLAREAIGLALADADIDYAEVQQAYTSYIYGDSCSGQTALYQVGMTGIPVFNVNNNCSSGSSAIYLARQAIESGACECVLVFGFEQMVPGAIEKVYKDRAFALDAHDEVSKAFHSVSEGPIAPGIFGGAAMAYQEKYGCSTETFAEICVKARRHAVNNPKSVFRDQLTVEEVMESPAIVGPITRLQCCPPTCGAAAAILCSERFARQHQYRASVKIAAQAIATDYQDAFSGDMLKLAGYDMSCAAAQQVYEQSGIGPEDIDVIELHDCFASNELISYEALGLVPEGEASRLVYDKDNTYGGKYVVNPSGGLLSKGHPIGATGVAQCAELVMQLRGQADKRQVENARVGLQHNLGLGGAVAVTLYRQVA